MKNAGLNLANVKKSRIPVYKLPTSLLSELLLSLSFLMCNLGKIIFTYRVIARINDVTHVKYLSWCLVNRHSKKVSSLVFKTFIFSSTRFAFVTCL